MPYTINGQPLDVQDPEDIGGVPFVPMAKIVEMLGGYVTWDNTNKIANIELGNKRVDVQLDNDTVTVNGDQVTLSSPPAMAHNTLWVPLELFQDVLGCNVSYNGNQVSISNL
jgi:N-acetylmuramoyl-L-alanine amidase